MIAASIAIFAMAALFVLFGLFRPGEERGCTGGHCGTCSDECELNPDGRRP